MLDSVDRPCAELTQPLARRRDLSIFRVLLAGHLHAAEPLDHFAGQQPLAIDPQQLAQGVRIATVGFLLGPLLRLD